MGSELLPDGQNGDARGKAEQVLAGPEGGQRGAGVALGHAPSKVRGESVQRRVALKTEGADLKDGRGIVRRKRWGFGTGEQDPPIIPHTGLLGGGGWEGAAGLERGGGLPKKANRFPKTAHKTASQGSCCDKKGSRLATG